MKTTRKVKPRKDRSLDLTELQNHVVVLETVTGSIYQLAITKNFCVVQHRNYFPKPLICLVQGPKGEGKVEVGKPIIIATYMVPQKSVLTSTVKSFTSRRNEKEVAIILRDCLAEKIRIEAKVVKRIRALVSSPKKRPKKK